MAVGEFYRVPEIHLGSATPSQFATCINWRRSTEKANWAGEQLDDLARMRPEELPPCFVAAAESISFRKGWETDHGRWVPKETYANNDFRAGMWGGGRGYSAPDDPAVMWVRSTLVFRPKKRSDASEYGMVMMVYNTISVRQLVLELEEDISLCCVFRVPKEKGKGVVRSEAPSVPPPPPPSEYTDLSYSELEAFCKSYFSDSESPSSNVLEDNAKGGWDLNSIDPSGGPQKRPRSNPKPVGGSEAWKSFSKIYTKDYKESKVVCVRGMLPLWQIDECKRR